MLLNTMTNETEIIIDVSELPPPKPMEIVLESLDRLIPGQYIKMIHRMQPHPLYNILLDSGYRYKVDTSEALINIYIWKASDNEAGQIIKDSINSR